MAGGVAARQSRAAAGVTSAVKIFANIFISFTGAGVLGLPYAFKEAGILEGILIVTFVGYVSVRAMFLIIDCKYYVLDRSATNSSSNGTTRASRSVRRRVANCSANSPKSLKHTSIDVSGESVEVKLPLMTPSSGYNTDTDTDDECPQADEHDSTTGVEHRAPTLDHSHEMTYGDLGFHAFGEKGRLLVDMTVIVSQIGFCCAYLIFISENLSSYFVGVTTGQWLLLLLPLLFLLCLLRNMARLAAFSVFAQLSTILAFAVVFWFDFEHWHVMSRFHPREFSLNGFPFFFAVSIYCYEGAGMILSLEHSLAERVRPHFKLYFARTIIAVTVLYIVFGCSGYLSFGPFTREIITLNLANDDGDGGGGGGGGSLIDFAILVKLCLSVSLFLTYPLMMFPVVTIVEKRLTTTTASSSSSSSTTTTTSSSNDNNSSSSLYSMWRGNVLRLCLVVCSGVVVLLIPNFANLMAVIGATCCTLLAFTLPGLFHLQLAARPLGTSARNFDMLLIVLGLAGSMVALWDTLGRMTHDDTAAAADEALLSAVKTVRAVVANDTAPLTNATNHSASLLSSVFKTTNQSSHLSSSVFASANQSSHLSSSVFATTNQSAMSALTPPISSEGALGSFVLGANSTSL